MTDPNNEKHYYQTGAISEKNIALIAEALRALFKSESESDSPDLQKVDDLSVLADHFEDADGNLIPVDGPDSIIEEEDENEDEDEDDEGGDGDNDE